MRRNRDKWREALDIDKNTSLRELDRKVCGKSLDLQTDVV